MVLRRHPAQIQNSVRARYPRLAMLAVSMHDESLCAECVIRAGARGYIMKQEATRNVLVVIRRILGSNIYLNEAEASHMASRIAGNRLRALHSAQVTDPFRQPSIVTPPNYMVRPKRR
jgi:DNA-binding NarL/FixJ family response regulator